MNVGGVKIQKSSPDLFVLMQESGAIQKYHNGTSKQQK